VEGPWGPKSGIREGGQFGARNQEPAATGSISMGRARNHLKTMVGGCLKWERGKLKAPGALNPAYERGGRFGARN
jgi:hypothetical protein